MKNLPSEELEPDVAVAQWLTEVGRRRPLAVATMPAEPAPAAGPTSNVSVASRLVLAGVFFLSAIQYVYVTTMLTIVSLPALVFFGIR